MNMPKNKDIWIRPGTTGKTYQIPVLVVEFPEPIRGAMWNGAHHSGEFSPDPGFDREEPAKAGYIKWGSWSLNFWFTAKTGKTWKVAAANAMKRLKAMTKVKGATFRTEWKTKDVMRY
jgi:hypothetical protein